jgi:glutamyl-tRNA synthetase/glutamyl-Q tRNA(Asp) synthetase
MQTLRTRFAPSPTGYLHLGHVVHALWVWGVARHLGAEVILRLEDHDRTRCRPEYGAALLDDLEWLGLRPSQPTIDSLRSGRSDFRQSDCKEVYVQQLELLKRHAHVYACDCSRKRISERTGEVGEELRYDGHCRHRNLPFTALHSIRVQLPEEEVFFEDLLLGPQTQHPASQCGDLQLRDNQGNWSYQFCVVVDDLRQEVNLVVRGMDILKSTGRQILLARMLGREAQPQFLHHPLLVDAQGRKLSKRDFDEDIHGMFLMGLPAEQVIGQAVWLAGWSPDAREMGVEEALGCVKRQLMPF